MAKEAKIEVVVMVTCWKRHPIGAMCFKGLHRLRTFAYTLGIELKPLIVYSELYYERLADSYAFHKVHAENRPLGEKHNVGLRYALDHISFDYFMQLGSDDLLSNKVLSLYKPLFEAQEAFIGLNELYVIDYYSKDTKRVAPGHVFGAGRCIRRDVLEQASDRVEVEMIKEAPDKIMAQFMDLGDKEYKARTKLIPNSEWKVPTGEESIHLWTRDKNSGLDFDSQERVFDIIQKISVVEYHAPLLVDIKTGNNINNFEAFINYESVPFTDVAAHFPELKTF